MVDIKRKVVCVIADPEGVVVAQGKASKPERIAGLLQGANRIRFRFF